MLIKISNERKNGKEDDLDMTCDSGEQIYPTKHKHIEMVTDGYSTCDECCQKEEETIVEKLLYEIL